MSGSRPPRWAELLLAWTADPERREAQLGDLAEEFSTQAADNTRAARRWYRRQALGSVLPNVAPRVRRVMGGWRSNQGDGVITKLWSDIRYSVRGFRKEVAFHLVVVLTLGLGIGAIATTFSVAYGLVIDPFPFPEPDRIVGIGTAYPRLGTGLGFFENLSPAEFEDLQDNSATLEEVVAWDMGNRRIDTDGPPENVFTAFWWGDALRTLGMDAHLGRGFTDDEIRTGTPAALLGYESWVDRFGADSSMVGSALGVNGVPHTLVGIFPEGVDVYGTDLWTTMPVGPEVFPRNRRQFQVMARIGTSSSLEAVNAELQGLAARTEQAYGAEFEEYEGWSMLAMTWNAVSSRFYSTGVYILLGAVSFVLLLVCANTANLLLGRARGRRREMAVRTALGAGRGRLVSQALTESVTLGLAAGLLGVGLAYLGVAGLDRFVTTMGLNVAGSIEINGPVLAFTAVVAIGTGIVFGLAPALQASSAGISGTLQSEGHSATAGRSRQRLQRTLVGVQVALAFVLLTGGGLLINSYIRVNRVEPGFEPADVLTMRLTLPREEYDEETGPAFFRQLTERLESIPGVRAAAAGTQYPGVAFAFRQIFVDGLQADTEATLPTMLTTVVTPGYFQALAIPLRRGRVFNDLDGLDAPNVAVINDEAAARYFPGEDPVGQRLKIGSSDPETPWWEIVGVVGSTHNLGLDTDPFPEVFAAHEQVGGSQNQLFLLLRSEGEPWSLVPSVRQAVLEVDADQPVYAIRTIDETYQQGVAPMRATALFLSIFAGFALVLASVGIYSVVSFTVSERTYEIGVRVALGADQARVRSLVVRQALPPVVIGAVVGVAAAIGVSGALQRLLYDVTGSDPLTLGSVALLLVGVAALASWVPAFRAARTDPVEALRAE